MKKVISLILSMALLLTLFTAIPVNAVTATEADDFKVEATDFVCGPYDRGEWGSHLKVSTVESGTKLEFLSGATMDISMAYATPVDLNGAHFKLTLDDVTAGRYTGIWINNTNANSASGGLFIKSTNNGERQFQISVGGFGDAKAINHSKYEYCYPGLSDRLQLPENLMSSTISEYEYRFSKNSDGSFTLTFNGYDIIISASDIAAAGIDTENAYIHFNDCAKRTVYTINYVHGGGENCTALSEDINASSASTAKEKVDLYYKAQALSEEGKKNVTNYADFVSASYGITDAKYYKSNKTNFTSNNDWEGVHLTRTEVEDGVRVTHITNGDYTVLGPWTATGRKLDGLTMSMTLNCEGYSDRMFNIGLCNGADQKGNNTPIRFQIEAYDSWTRVFRLGERMTSDVTGKIYDVTGTSDYRMPSNSFFNREINTYTFKFDVDLIGNLTVYVNDVLFITLSAADIAASGLNVDNTYIKIGSQGGLLDYTLHYVRGGNEATFEEITDSRYYKVTSSDFSDWGWSSVTKNDTEDGLNVKYSARESYIYTQWSNKAVDVDGLKLAYTINSSSYYARIIHLGLAKSDQTNPDIANTPLNVQLENGWIRVLINGTAVTEAEYSYSNFDTTNKIIPCGDIVNMEVDRYEFEFKSEDNGGLSIYINNTKMITLSATQLASTGLDFANARVKFSPANDYPAEQSEFIDFTIHYIKSGDLVNQARFDKPAMVEGDVNADNTVNILDYIRLKNYFINDGSYPIFKQAADIVVAEEDADVAITSDDFVGLKKLLMGL